MLLGYLLFLKKKIAHEAVRVRNFIGDIVRSY